MGGLAAIIGGGSSKSLPPSPSGFVVSTQPFSLSYTIVLFESSGSIICFELLFGNNDRAVPTIFAINPGCCGSTDWDLLLSKPPLLAFELLLLVVLSIEELARFPPADGPSPKPGGGPPAAATAPGGRGGPR